MNSQSNQTLLQYNKDLLNVASTLKKEEAKMRLIDNRIEDKKNDIAKTIDELEEYNFNLDMRLKTLIEQSDFLDILSPELERARIKQQYLYKKQTEYDNDSNICKQNEMRNQHVFYSLSVGNQKLFDKVNKRIFDIEEDDNVSNDNEGNDNSDIEEEDESENMTNEERELIEIVKTKCKGILPRKKSSNTITVISTRKRLGSISKKKSMSTNSSLNQLNRNDALFASPIKTIEGVVNPNKSFYLLWNSRIQQSITNLAEITPEDLGGHHCCKRLLKAYYHNINFTNKIRSKSLTCNRPTRSLSHTSQRENRKRKIPIRDDLPRTIHVH